MEPFDRVVHASTFGEIIAECRGEIDILAACRLYATQYLSIFVLDGAGKYNATARILRPDRAD
jgi:hypothetical protein